MITKLTAPSFSDRLRELCANQPEWPTGHGLGSYIARRYGKSPAAADRWLNKNVIPDDEVMAAMAADFGVSLGQLRYGETPVTAPEIPAAQSAQILLLVHRALMAQNIDPKTIPASKMTRLFDYLYRYANKHEAVDDDEVINALRLAGVIV